MSLEADRLAGRARELRDEFDGVFAEPVPSGAGEVVDLLGIRVAGQAYAMRVEEVAGVHADRRVVPLPSPLPELIGIVGLRGVVVGVYDLAALLGHSRANAPRWLALARSAPVAFAFGEFERHLRVPLAAVAHESSNGVPDSGLRRALSGPEGGRQIIALGPIIHELKQRAQVGAPTKDG